MNSPRHHCRLLATILLTGLAIEASLGGSAVLGADPAPAPPAKAPASPRHLVLCWYMVCYGNSVEGYKQEMELAQRHGIDGFVLDVGGWKQQGKTGLVDTNYSTSVARMYQAAKELNTGFTLSMAPEYSVGPMDACVYDMVKLYHDHPNQLMQDGKPVFTGYGNASMFVSGLEKLRAEGIATCYVSAVFFPRFLYSPSIETFYDEFANTPSLDGLMTFNPVQLGAILSDNANGRRATQRLGKIFAANVSPAYNSANLQDYRGISGYLQQWQGAVNDGADWISIVIWNDYNEDSGLMPNRWPAGAQRDYYDRDETFLQATAYGSAWFKSGRSPAITQDQIYVTYRNRSKWLRKGFDHDKTVDISLFAGGRYDQIHDDVEDLVYVDVFLTAPATVTVDLGGTSKKYDLPAGVGHIEHPMSPGVPHIRLERDKKALADFIGRKQIVAEATPRNSELGDHLANRTWTSGEVAGTVAKHLNAKVAVPGTGADAATIEGTPGFKIADQKDASVDFPVTGLKTGTYNVRITYSNASADEARLSLVSDGPGRDKGAFPYFIPAFLPPTKDGKLETVSFLWSLYDNTTHLKLQWIPGNNWGQPNPQDNDHGSITVTSIDLVPVDPVQASAIGNPLVPELVTIAGGKFKMGSDTGEPDERPRRTVTISTFAMAKNKVTNAEFERFDPSHRKVRNGNSWRDREPVIAISWIEAAKYCNWLSEQNGLTPVYSEQPIDPAKPAAKAWVADFKADGFRLPTEAEWEYEATGRGEGRTYPWGEAAPIPGVHGRFQGHAALAKPLPLPATEDNGAVVVGSYPLGASRDGVMDLAGNVGEWCNDWYNYYPSEDQTDPCQTTPSNYRVIRGGSWSWYGYSQRGAHREFNSQNYPGHAYYGLRVVISEAGARKLKP